MIGMSHQVGLGVVWLSLESQEIVRTVRNYSHYSHRTCVGELWIIHYPTLVRDELRNQDFELSDYLLLARCCDFYPNHVTIQCDRICSPELPSKSAY